MKPTVLIQAPLYSRSGYGAHARDIALSLFDSRKFNIVAVPTGWGTTSTTYNVDSEDFEKLNAMVANNSNLQKNGNFIFICVGLPSEFQKVGRHTIGITAGIEATQINKEWVDKMNSIDAVIVPSNFVSELFKSQGVTTTIYVVAEGVDLDIYGKEAKGTTTLGSNFPTSFNFMYGGQWLPGRAGSDRKGIGTLIKAFLEEFEGDADVGLVLKTFSKNMSSPDKTLTMDRIEQIKGKENEGKFPQIHLIHGDMSDEEMNSLYLHPSIKAFISPTSGEGWHRMLAEAITCDLPVAVTGWSGHMDYVSKNDCTIIPYTMSRVPISMIRQGYCPPEATWASPDITELKKIMRKMYTDIVPYKKLAREAGEVFRVRYSKERTYSSLISIMDSFDMSENVPNILPIGPS